MRSNTRWASLRTSKSSEPSYRHALKPEIWLQPLSQSRTATELCIREATARNWRVSIQTQKFIGVR